MKNLFLLIVIWLGANSVVSGQAFVQLSNATGYEYTLEELTDLDQVSQELQLSFNDSLDFRDFKVYTGGNYIHNSRMSGGIESYWAKLINQCTSSKYRLVLGHFIDESGNIVIKVDTKLPNQGQYECLDIISPTFRSSINEVIANKANFQVNSGNLAEKEREAILHLKSILDSKLCCDLGRQMPICDDCLILEQDKHHNQNNNKVYYPSRDIHKELVNKEFIMETVTIIQDDEYNIPQDQPSLQNPNGSANRSILGVNATIQFESGEITTIENLLTELNSSISDNPTVYEYKFPRDCGAFDDLWEAYEADQGNAIFISLINVDRIDGTLGYHMKINDVNGFRSEEGNNRNDTANPTGDDLEGMQEILTESGQACGDLLYAYIENNSFHVNKRIGSIFLSAEDQAYYKDYYDNRENRIISKLTEAGISFGYYYSIEWVVQKKKFNRWDWTAAIVAKYRMCRQTVHGLLDLCGVIEPGGLICDGANALIYALEGDGKNFVLSSFAIVPVIGTSATATKIGKKVIQSTASTGSLILEFSVKTKKNAIHWVGGRGRLKTAYKRLGIIKYFDGIVLNPNSNPVHHIIPWALVNREAASYIDKIAKKLAKVGWHPSNPMLNGMVVPQKLQNGQKFHFDSHDKYSKKMNSLVEIITDLNESQILDRMKKLTKLTEGLIEKAYKNNKSINETFEGLIITIKEIDSVIL